MPDQTNFAPAGKSLREAREAAQLDLEMHARLEAGLLDAEPKPLMPAVQGPEKPSLWQALKKFFH
jgi:hypothetical protein